MADPKKAAGGCCGGGHGHGHSQSHSHSHSHSHGGGHAHGGSGGAKKDCCVKLPNNDPGAAAAAKGTPHEGHTVIRLEDYEAGKRRRQAQRMREAAAAAARPKVATARPPGGSVVDCRGRTRTLRGGLRLAAADAEDVMVIETADSGKGVSSMALLEEGRVVVSEPGLVLTERQRVDPAAALARVKAALGGDGVEAAVAEAVTKLEAHGLPWDTDEGMLELLNTNAFSLAGGARGQEGMDKDGDSERHSVVLPLIARVNHACVPNCAVRLNREAGSGELVALRNIAPNTELTISYCREGHGWDRASRRGVLSRIKKFWCECPLCQHEAASDAAAAKADGAAAQPTVAAENADAFAQYIMSHSPEEEQDRSLEEYIAGMHVVGQLRGYAHWGVVFIASGLLKNALAGIDTASGAEEPWLGLSVTLLSYLRRWGACPQANPSMTFDYLPNWYVSAVLQACHKVMHASTASQHEPLITACFELIEPWHRRYYTAVDPDQRMIESWLRVHAKTPLQQVGAAAPAAPAAPVTFTKADLTVHLGSSSHQAVVGHTKRIVDEFAGTPATNRAKPKKFTVRR